MLLRCEQHIDKTMLQSILQPVIEQKMIAFLFDPRYGCFQWIMVKVSQLINSTTYDQNIETIHETLNFHRNLSVITLLSAKW